ncbi:outer membrane beta-barrel protein [Psychroserpens sp. AS72]|uniref:outer membrane beta-barrel protein n=1 Tax=Psychroserpens sp. AS72 TaxID=3135775 RepID=UPI00316D0639
MLKALKTIISSITLILFFSLFATAQIQYEKGYFISNNGSRTECLIKNIDWKNTPTEFSYKINENSSTEAASIEQVSKFEIYNQCIYIRANVEIEVNTTTVNKLDYNDKLELKTQQVFLKILVEGKSNLYMYKDANSKSYYYKLEDNDIKILKYKEYINKNNQIAKNQEYKSELWNNLKCNSIDMNLIKNLHYTESDIKDFIVNYNTCMNDLTYTFINKKRENVFNIAIRPGISFSEASIDTPGGNSSIINDLSFDKETSIRFGVELEYIFPFNNGKWSLILEPTYEYYKTEKTYNSTPNSIIVRPETANVDYSYINFPLGIRHYSYLNTNSRIFINGSAVFNIPFNSKIDFSNNVYDIDNVLNLAFGLGYSYKNKFSFEARLSVERELLDKYVTTSGKYKSVSLIFGYTIF